MRRPNPHLRLLTTYVVVATLLVTWLAFTQRSQTSETGLASHRSINQAGGRQGTDFPKPTSPTRSSWKHYGLQTPTPKPAPKPPLVALAAPGTVQARIAEVWPGNDAAILCIVSKETGGTFKPTIKSPTGKYWGLLQMDASFRASYGWTGWGVKEQMLTGWRGFQARGYVPWPTRHGCV